MISDVEDEVLVRPVNTDHRYKASPKPISPDEDPAFKTLFLRDGSYNLPLVKESILAAPHVDQDKVEYFKKEIASGRYKVSNERIAMRMTSVK